MQLSISPIVSMTWYRLGCIKPAAEFKKLMLVVAVVSWEYTIEMTNHSSAASHLTPIDSNKA